jgi:glycosyltransferase involved in cell wall biosynthesis
LLSLEFRKITLLGFVEDDNIPDYFEACDMFCLSSIWKTEAFAIVQIEAMSCGNLLFVHIYRIRSELG